MSFFKQHITIISLLQNNFEKKIILHFTKFYSHCLSLYECELFNLENNNIFKLSTARRVCGRRIAGLPSRTHSNYLDSIFTSNNIFDILCKELLIFI